MSQTYNQDKLLTSRDLDNDDRNIPYYPINKYYCNISIIFLQNILSNQHTKKFIAAKTHTV